FFFSSRRRHTISKRDWSSDVCSSDLPSSFLPEEDQGVFLTMIQLPAGATQERTQKVLDQVTDYYLKNEKANVESVFTVNGFSFSGQAQNAGMAFVSLKPWEERNSDENSAEAVINRS